MHSDDSQPAKCDSSFTMPSSEPEASSPSNASSASTTGGSLKPSRAKGRSATLSPSPSDSPDTLSVLSLIEQSLAIQDSLQLSMDDREQDAREKAFAMTWGNPLWLAARKRQADQGKEPQWLSEKGAGFDRKVEPPAPLISIRFQQVFPDGDRVEKVVTVGPTSGEK